MRFSLFTILSFSLLVPNLFSAPTPKNKSDIFADLALHDAIRTKNIELVKVLVSPENINLKNESGTTPLHIATQLNQYEIAKYLISKGADVKNIDNFKDTALIDATRNRSDLNLIKLLICNGADINYKDKYSISSKDYAAKSKNEELLDFMATENTKEACENKGVKVVLLDDGNPKSSILVQMDNQEVTLDKPYQNTEISSVYEEKLAVKQGDESILSSSEKELLNYHTTWSKTSSFNVNFEFDSTKITEASNKELVKINEILKICKSCEVELNGHTDTKGKKEYNQKLSEKRAQKIKDSLYLDNVKSVKINTFGEDSPFIKTDDDVNNESNRRVEIIIKEM